MSETCCATQGNIMILACAGGSNVGQLSNQAAIELTREGIGKIFCLAGIGGNLSGFVQSAKDIDRMVTIDGCKVGCAKAILEQAGVPLKEHVVITDLGIEKKQRLQPESRRHCQGEICGPENLRHRSTGSSRWSGTQDHGLLRMAIKTRMRNKECP